MKKLLKHEWKFYGGIILLLTVILIGWHWELGREYTWRLSELKTEDIFNYVPDMLRSMYYIEAGNIVITVAAYCLLKLYQYQTEKSSYGRDVLATLPVRKTERVWFYLLADAVFVLLPNIAYILIKYVCMKTMLADYQIAVPWLSDAVLPMILATSAYLLMLLSVSRFIESLIVNGVWKIFGSVVVGIMCIFCLSCLELDDAFIFIGHRGNIIDYYDYWDAGYSQKYWEMQNRAFDVDHVDDIEIADLYHGEDGIGLEVYYKGEPIENTVYSLEAYYRDNHFQNPAYYAAGGWLSYDWEMRAFVNYGKIPDAELVKGNLALAAVLLLLTACLAGRREESETILYFRFAKYLFAFLVSLTVCCMALQLDMAVWQMGMTVFAAVGMFVLCVNWLTPRQERRLGEGKEL